MSNLSPTAEPTTPDVTALYQQALEKAESEEYEEALSLLAAARRQAPDHVGLYLTAAEIMATDQEDYAGACALVEAAEQRRPGAPMVACTRAEIDFQRGDFQAAAAAFRELADRAEVAAVAAAGVAKSLLAQARQLVERRKFDAAGRLLQESLQWEDTGAAHLNLGICHHALGQA